MSSSKLPLKNSVEPILRSGSTSSYCSEEPQVPPHVESTVSYLQDLEELPQGRHLGLFSTIVLFVSRILGSGIFSIASSMFDDCGRSPFLFFLAWFIAAAISFSGLYVFLELGLLVPRSGGIKVFLEFIYEKPKLLATVAFLVQSVLLGFTISNCLVFGEYLLHSLGISTNDFNIRATGLIFLYLAAGIHGVSVSHGVRIQNVLGGMKLGLMGIMVLIGFYVVFIPKEVTKIDSNLHWNDFFTVHSRVTSSGFASAVIKASFAFSGWNSVHTVSSEIKDPVRTFKIAGPFSLLIIAATYLFTNLAYLIVIPPEELANGRTLVGSILFEKVLGQTFGRQFLTFAVALCAGGNIFVVIYTISRVSQEVFREGYLPFSAFMSSNKPFGAPLRTLILSVSITLLCFLVFPLGDIYSYIVEFEGIIAQIFIMLSAVGIFIIRRRYRDLRAPIRASLFGTAITILVSACLIISPLATRLSPNPKGLEGLPSYAITAVLFLLGCVGYWYVKFELLPKIFGYELVLEDVELEDGLMIRKWVNFHR